MLRRQNRTNFKSGEIFNRSCQMQNRYRFLELTLIQSFFTFLDYRRLKFTTDFLKLLITFIKKYHCVPFFKFLNG